MRALARRLAFVAAGLLALSARPGPAAPGAPQQPSFPAEVELVVVDTTVSDRDGRPIRGLGAADFTVLEDGQPQSISSFEAVTVEQPTRSAAAPDDAGQAHASTNARQAVGTGRTFVIVFDNRNMTTTDAFRAKAAAARFIESGAREGDLLMLVATEGDAWWSARMDEGRAELLAMLKRLDGRLRHDTSPDRVTPWEAMRIHVYRDQEVAFRVLQRLERANAIPSDATGRTAQKYALDNTLLTQRASQVYLDSVQRNRATLGLVDRILVSLEGSRGRKSVLLLSGGFIHDNALGEFKRVNESARRSNVVLYFVDARGLEGLPLEMTAEFGIAPEPRDLGQGGLGGEYMGSTMLSGELASEGAQTLAADSGGFTIKNANDLGSGIARIARESEAYYLLGYRPRASAGDARYRKIEVKVARGGAVVRARKGYYPGFEGGAAPAAAAGAKDAGFQRALDSPYPSDAVPLRLSALVFHEAGIGKASVLVAGEVDVSGFAFEERDGRLADDLQYLLVVARGDSGEHFRHDENVELRLSPATRDGLARSGYLVARPFDLAPGRYQAKLLVRDRNNGRIGSVTHAFQVPRLDELRTSTPLLTDQVQPSADRPRPVLRVRRTFTPAATLYCEYEVYGAAQEAPAAAPRVVAGYEIRRADGAVVSRVEPTPIRPSSLGKLSRLIAAPLWRVPPGAYQIVLLLKDEVGRREIEVREPFEVVAASGS